MKKIQQQKQLTAHDKVLIFENFHYLLEALEEYIEKAGFYPDFKNKRQLKNVTVKDDLSLNQAENLFKTRLLIFAGMETPNFLADEVKEELYRWINTAGIDANNCPEKLRHFLLETNNVIEGNDEKIIKQTQENLDSKKDDANFQSMDNVMKVFSAIQKPLDEKREQGKSFEGKSHTEINVGSKFGGSVESGQRTFDQITSTISSSSRDFHFFSQQNNLQNRTNSEIIQDVRQNPRNWRLDEVITEYDNLGRAIKKDLALIHISAQIGFDGAVLDNNQPVYLAQRFDQREIAQINQNLSISQQQVQQPPYYTNK